MKNAGNDGLRSVTWITILQPIRLSDLRKVDPLKACEYFNNCFKDPSTFTVVIVGNINPTLALPLILQYLVSGIPFSCNSCHTHTHTHTHTHARAHTHTQE